MNRDMDAIKKILMAVKESDKPVSNVEGMPSEVFRFNALLLDEAGLVEGAFKPSSRKADPTPIMATIYRLTWNGFEFADLASDETLWEKVKKHIVKPAAAYSFMAILEYLKQEAIKKIGK